MKAYLIWIALVSISVLSGCSSSYSEFEGQWVEAPRVRWEGATDASYRAYIEELEKLGPRRFVFEGGQLTVYRQDVIVGEYSIKFTNENKLIAFGTDGETLYRVIHRFDSNTSARSNVYLRTSRTERLEMIWPAETTVLQETRSGDSVQQIIEEIQETITLTKVAS
ncbi:hypothetical protein GC197_09930 [bacterium]|nr:hypothetical protein [bacterium]